MIILDTNVISELAKSPALRSERVRAWLAIQPVEQLWIASVAYAELLSGIFMMPEGRRRRITLEATQAIVMTDLDSRILSFDAEAAIAYARIFAERKAKGLSTHTADIQIAAIATIRGFAVATRNVADFGSEGLTVINPWNHPVP